MRFRHPALTALLACALAASGFGADQVSPPPAPMPADAPPAEIVRAFIEALDRGDRDALRELATPHFAGRAAAWLPNLERASASSAPSG